MQELETALQQAQAASTELSPELQAQFDESQEQLQRYAAAAEHSSAESENLRGEIEGLQKELEEAQVRVSYVCTSTAQEKAVLIHISMNAWTQR